MPEAHDDPFLFIGQTVHWFPHGDVNQPPHAAFVTGIGQISLCLNVISPKHYNTSIKDGVRRMGDPALLREELKPSGGWDHTPQTKMLMEALGPPKVKKEEPKKKEVA